MRLMDIYNKLPIFLQNAAVAYEGTKIQQNRYGRLFDRHFHDVLARNDMSQEALLQYRDKKIADIVRYSYFHVPYYKASFDKAGIRIEEIKGLKDLSKLPIIDKSVVQKNYRDFISDEYRGRNRRIIHYHTSGTTGAGLHYRMTRDADAQSWAIAWRERERIGIFKGGGLCVGILVENRSFQAASISRLFIE